MSCFSVMIYPCSIFLSAGPSHIQIEGPDVIDIAEKYKFVCTSECLPSCRCVTSVDSQTGRGNVIELMVDHPLKSVNLKCEAQNTGSRKTVTALKTVHVKGREAIKNGLMYILLPHIHCCYLTCILVTFSCVQVQIATCALVL